jgi:hypothetical protein
VPTEEEGIISRLRGEAPKPPPTSDQQQSIPAHMPASSPGAAFRTPAGAEDPRDEVGRALDRLAVIEVDLAYHTNRAYLEPLNAGWEHYEATSDALRFCGAVVKLEHLLKLVARSEQMDCVLRDRHHPDIDTIFAGCHKGALEDRKFRKEWSAKVEAAWKGYLAAAGPMTKEIAGDLA